MAVSRYCGFEAKPGEMDQTSGVDGNGEDVPGLGMKQLEKAASLEMMTICSIHSVVFTMLQDAKFQSMCMVLGDFRT